MNSNDVLFKVIEEISNLFDFILRSIIRSGLCLLIAIGVIFLCIFVCFSIETFQNHLRIDLILAHRLINRVI